ncbi:MULTISPECIES: bacteriocin immunity protein [Pseudomonas]|uniref:bacteriocin immunity protein n=1 Tax=Pseudomonas TaxID=286 RepID=UPI000D206E4E|nr:MULTISPECIES: bacteriocin immunity protein [Pseudomonas]AVX91071.1 bacteriocin immunity protein [Pseudomonas koreensis]MBI6947117.1 bacteriocin immunity protein [Pseudomonas koreensis]MCU7217395.1 bacteriocin immunity protein [Pseudomonas sp. VE 196-7]
MKKNLSEYTEAEFLRFMQEIRTANKSTSDDVLDPLLDHFCSITEHPDGTDLIYYPDEGVDNSNEGITETVKKWRAANGLPGFKQ